MTGLYWITMNRYLQCHWDCKPHHLRLMCQILVYCPQNTNKNNAARGGRYESSSFFYSVWSCLLSVYKYTCIYLTWALLYRFANLKLFSSNDFMKTTLFIFVSVNSMSIGVVIFPLINLVSQVIAIKPSVNFVNKAISTILFQILVVLTIFNPLSDQYYCLRNAAFGFCRSGDSSVWFRLVLFSKLAGFSRGFYSSVSVWAAGSIAWAVGAADGPGEEDNSEDFLEAH